MRLLAECGLEIIYSRSLVAPVIWCYSLKAFVKRNFPSANWTNRFFDVNNLPLIAVFTAMDLTAILLRIPTSNQEMVAQQTELQPIFRHVHPPRGGLSFFKNPT